jgi:TPR repeat protein
MKNKVKPQPDLSASQFDFYQSANNDSQTIKNCFVIRLAEFELIIADLRNKQKGDPLQHELILGRRGSGKSTLLRRIQIEIDEDPELSSKYIAINLAEEQAGVYRLFDLWVEILKELSIKFDITFSLKGYSSFTTLHSYTDYLYDEINSILAKYKKKVVLLLDNIDRILENFQEDGNLLRETLLNYDDLQIIGGSTRMDEHFWRYDKPFYEFFRRHRLEALSKEETHTLLIHWSELMNLPQLKGFVKNNPGKIEAVRILTDGLPRTLQFFIQILLRDSTLYGFDYIKKVMDKVTPLYQERLNHLPAPHRKIVLEMAFVWEACSVKQLAEKCSMESKLVSSQLQKLSHANIVETINTSKKNHLYRVSERFFNMWLIITQGNPEQKRKAKWLSIFLEAWYDVVQVKALALAHIKNLQSKKMSYDKAIVLTKALSQSRHITTSQRDEMLDFTTELNEPDFQYDLLPLPKKYREIADEILKLINEHKYGEAHKLTDELENEDDGVKFAMKGRLFEFEGNKKDAKEYYLKSIQKGDLSALRGLANLCAEEGEYKKAESYYLSAITNGDLLAINDLGVLYYDQDKDTLAEIYYRQALEIGDRMAFHNLLNLYYYANQNKGGALELIRKYGELYKDKNDFESKLLVEIWNGIFENLEQKVWNVVEQVEYEGLTFFIRELLVQEQTHLVLKLFRDPTHGKILQEKYSPLYYAGLLLTDDKSIDNVDLRIPPEVMPTVLNILDAIKEGQSLYSKS